MKKIKLIAVLCIPLLMLLAAWLFRLNAKTLTLPETPVVSMYHVETFYDQDRAQNHRGGSHNDQHLAYMLEILDGLHLFPGKAPKITNPEFESYETVTFLDADENVVFQFDLLNSYTIATEDGIYYANLMDFQANLNWYPRRMDALLDFTKPGYWASPSLIFATVFVAVVASVCYGALLVGQILLCGAARKLHLRLLLPAVTGGLLLALLCYPGMGYWINMFVLYPFLRGNPGIYLTNFANIGTVVALSLGLLLELAVIGSYKTNNEGVTEHGTRTV